MGSSATFEDLVKRGTVLSPLSLLPQIWIAASPKKYISFKIANRGTDTVNTPMSMTEHKQDLHSYFHPHYFNDSEGQQGSLTLNP